MKEYIKQFDDWIEVKKRVNTKDRTNSAKVGDVRWASIGVNVGSEIDGKGIGSHTRPVLVIGSAGKNLALVVPFTTKMHKRPGFLPFPVTGKDMCLCIHQVRVLSQKRLLKRMVHVADTRVEEVKRAIVQFWNL